MDNVWCHLFMKLCLLCDTPRYASGAGTFDSRYGVYKLDCSHYVDNILHRVDRRAYANLEMATGAPMPNSANYYDFFTRLSSNIRHDWDKVDNAKELQPGDVLVFRYKKFIRCN